ncbi:MAG: IS481 family transposase [Verrucomicrobiota bacterium]
MPWDICNLVKRRSEFVKLALQIQQGEGFGNFAQLCDRYGISRKTGYKWVKRYRSDGTNGLEDRSRRPRNSPRKTPDAVEERVTAVRKKHPSWGGRKIRNRLEMNRCVDIPAASSISHILRRNGLMEEKPRGESHRIVRFERDRPNQLWQMDFKGHFGLSGGGRCHPLTALDDHSRFNLILAACRDEKGATVKRHLQEAFRRYGLPDQILCDNGASWSCPGHRQALGRLEAWLVRVGVEVIHGRPYHPQTQGKEERFHKTLDVDLLRTRPSWASHEECDAAFGPFRQLYNEERPHDALGGRPPIERYRISERSYDETSEKRHAEEHYLEGDTLRKVSKSGEISFRSNRVYVGVGITGETVALRAYDEGIWKVSYAWKELGVVAMTDEKHELLRLEKLPRNPAE